MSRHIVAGAGFLGRHEWDAPLNRWRDCLWGLQVPLQQDLKQVLMVDAEPGADAITSGESANSTGGTFDLLSGNDSPIDIDPATPVG